MPGTPSPIGTPGKPYFAGTPSSPPTDDSSPFGKNLHGEIAAVGSQLCNKLAFSPPSLSSGTDMNMGVDGNSEDDAEGGVTLQPPAPTSHHDIYSDLDGDGDGDIIMEDLDLYGLATTELEDVTTADAYPFVFEDDDTDMDIDDWVDIGSEHEDKENSSPIVVSPVSPTGTLPRLMDPARPVVPIPGLFRSPRPRSGSGSGSGPSPSSSASATSNPFWPLKRSLPDASDDDIANTHDANPTLLPVPSSSTSPAGRPDTPRGAVTGRQRRALSSLSHFSTLQGRLALGELKWHLELPADLSPGGVLHGLVTKWTKIRRVFGSHHPRLAADLNRLDWTGVAETAETHEAYLSCMVWSLAFSGTETLFTQRARQLVHLAGGGEPEEGKEEESDGKRRVRQPGPGKSSLSQVWTAEESEQ